jgi:hypothetical protein
MAPPLTNITGSLINPVTGSKVTAGALVIKPNAPQHGVRDPNGDLIGEFVSPITVVVSISGSGDLDFNLVPNVNAGSSYTVEFDSDPADTVTPRSLKPGYFKTVWIVPTVSPTDIATL